VVTFLLLFTAAVVVYYHYWRPGKHSSVQTAYVLPDTVQVVDSPAEIHLDVATLKNDERVEVLARTSHWTKVRLADGRTGWIESNDLLGEEDYVAGQHLLKELVNIPAQASGHTDGVVNLRLDPSREAPQLAQLEPNRKLEMFGRRLVERPPRPGQPAAPSVKEAWYLIQAQGHAGWVLGRFVDLDIPPGLWQYAQGTNMVAWLVLNTVDDDGRQVPQYLTAERVGVQDVDFNHIRVFTWWIKTQEYVTAYVESGLKGYFPIRVTHEGGIPYFRLRLLDNQGNRIQKVYGLFDTITRPLGTVAGWESDGMPTAPPERRRRRRR
jgi:hypothetical protein